MSSVAVARRLESTSLQELLSCAPDQLAGVDVARANLLCAEGLPGAEDLDVERYLGILALWVKRIQAQTNRHLPVFRRNPEKYKNSEAYWRILALTTILWSEFNIRYNTERIEKEDWSDSRDILIHGLLGPKRTGTCTTLPVLAVAIGRRLGYPLFLVHTVGHKFFCWEDAVRKERRNFEFSGDGLECHSDQFYREWPAKWPAALVADETQRGSPRRYLRNLAPPEELADALAMRAVCLETVGRWEKSLKAYQAAVRFAPDNPSHAVFRDDLAKKTLAADELLAGVRATTPNFDPNLPALITAKVAVDHKGPFLSISYKQLPHPIAPSDPSFDPTFQPPPGISPALFRIRRVVHDIHSKSRPMAGFRPATPPSNL